MDLSPGCLPRLAPRKPIEKWKDYDSEEPFQLPAQPEAAGHADAAQVGGAQSVSVGGASTDSQSPPVPAGHIQTHSTGSRSDAANMHREYPDEWRLSAHESPMGLTGVFRAAPYSEHGDSVAPALEASTAAQRSTS